MNRIDIEIRFIVVAATDRHPSITVRFEKLFELLVQLSQLPPDHVLAIALKLLVGVEFPRVILVL